MFRSLMRTSTTEDMNEVVDDASSFRPSNLQEPDDHAKTNVEPTTMMRTLSLDNVDFEIVGRKLSYTNILQDDDDDDIPHDEKKATTPNNNNRTVVVNDEVENTTGRFSSSSNPPPSSSSSGNSSPSLSVHANDLTGSLLEELSMDDNEDDDDEIIPREIDTLAAAAAAENSTSTSASKNDDEIHVETVESAESFDVEDDDAVDEVVVVPSPIVQTPSTTSQHVQGTTTTTTKASTVVNTNNSSNNNNIQAPPTTSTGLPVFQPPAQQRTNGMAAATATTASSSSTTTWIPRKVYITFYLLFGMVASVMVSHQIKKYSLSYFYNNDTTTTTTSAAVVSTSHSAFSSAEEPWGMVAMQENNINNLDAVAIDTTTTTTTTKEATNTVLVNESATLPMISDGIMVPTDSGANSNHVNNSIEEDTESETITLNDFSSMAMTFVTTIVDGGEKAVREAATATGGFDLWETHIVQPFQKCMSEAYNYVIDICIQCLQVLAAIAITIGGIYVAIQYCWKSSTCATQPPTTPSPLEPSALLPPVHVPSQYNIQREQNGKKANTATIVPNKSPNKLSIQTKNDIVVPPATWSLSWLSPTKKELPFWEREYNLTNYIELLDCLQACNQHFVRNGRPSRAAAGTRSRHGYNTIMYEHLTLNELQFIARGLRVIGISPTINKATLIDNVIMAYAKVLVSYTMPMIKEILSVKAKRPVSEAKKQDLVKLTVEAAF